MTLCQRPRTKFFHGLLGLSIITLCVSSTETSLRHHIRRHKSLQTVNNKKSNNNNLLRQQVPFDISNFDLSNMRQTVGPSGEFIVDQDTEVALDKPFDNPVLNDVPTWHKGTERAGEDYATVSKAEAAMDASAPFDPAVAASLKIPKPKVKHNSGLNNVDLLSSLDPTAHVEDQLKHQTANGLNDIGTWGGNKDGVNEAPALHHAHPSAAEFQSLDNQVDPEVENQVPSVGSDTNSGGTNSGGRASTTKERKE